MTPLEWQEIEHELENTPTAAPPQDLLVRIQEEIPAAEELRSEAHGPLGIRRHWLMAASVLVALSAGFLAYQVRRETPPLGSTPPTISSGSPQTDALERKRGVLRDQLESLAAPDDLPSAPSDPSSSSNMAVPQVVAAPPPVAIEAREDAREAVSALLKASGDESRTDESLNGAPAAPRPKAAGEHRQEHDRVAPGAAPSAAVAIEESIAAARPRQAAGTALKALGDLSGPGVRGIASTGGTAEPNDAPYGDVFFESAGTNPFIDTEDDPLSTFGLDVDTGSYTVARRFLRDGHLPPAGAIRVEEFVNYFDYRDAPPKRGDFALRAEAAPSIFGGGPRHYLVRFNVSGRVVSAENRKPATLVFVVDVSGSMNRENRLGLVKKSLGLLLDELRPDDRVGLVVYGHQAQVVLEPTSDLERIRTAIDRLQSSGSTNAEDGILTGYRLISRERDGALRNVDEVDEHGDRRARRIASMPREDRIYRVILCSDGVANVGRTGPRSILERIEREASSGIELTTVGFGMGNYNDVLMEQLADRGDGSYAYVDTLHEARRIFVENLTGTLQTIASDAKIQVEFDSETVSRYRLLGYENRAIADEDFRNDAVDAGEIGAGHTVTALYEIKLHADAPRRGEIARLNLRYRSKASGRVEETSTRLRLGEVAERWETASPSLRLASLVGEFAELLKGSYWAEGGSLGEVLTRAQRVSAELAGDADIAELVDLIGKAARLQPSAGTHRP